MKKYLYLLLLLALLASAGCGDEGIEPPLDALTPGAPTADLVTTVPPHIQAFLFDRHGSREKLLAKLIDLKHGDPQVDEKFMANWYLRVICQMDRQRNYYEKYINAGGVAVMGGIHTDDRYFIAARNIILTMTAKHPEIREKLQPKNSGYYFALVPNHLTPAVLPDFPMPTNVSYALGRCGARLCFATVGFNYYDTFVHEFAHAIERMITETHWTQTDPADPLPPLDPTFEARLEHAYKEAKKAKKWREEVLTIVDGEIVKTHEEQYIIRNYKEYWAEGVVTWYYLNPDPGRNVFQFASREEFAAYDPLLYALLSEWFHEGSFKGL